jgi:hypothetical protein
LPAAYHTYSILSGKVTLSGHLEREATFFLTARTLVGLLQ